MASGTSLTFLLLDEPARINYTVSTMRDGELRMAYNGFTNRETWLYSVAFAHVMKNLSAREMTAENIELDIIETPRVPNSIQDLIINSVDVSLVDFEDLANKFLVVKKLDS